MTIGVFNPQSLRLLELLNGSKIKGQYQLVVTNQFNNLAKAVYFLWLRHNKKGNVVKFVKY